MLRVVVSVAALLWRYKTGEKEMLDDKPLAELDEAEKKATAGPLRLEDWRATKDDPSYNDEEAYLQSPDVGTIAACQFYKDAEFFALSRTHMRALLDLVQFQKEEIQALTHEGRRGELEQANVGLADENEKLRAELVAARAALDALSSVRPRMSESVGTLLNKIRGMADEGCKRIDDSGLLKKEEEK